MKKFMQLTLISLIAILSISFAAPLAMSVSAINVFSESCGEGGDGSDSAAPGGVGGSATEGSTSGGDSSTAICGAAKTDDAPDIIKSVINMILILLGMITVVMIVIGGVRYTTSNGDASGVKGAKDTIMYAVVGLVIAILAYAIVNFVLGQFS